MPGSRSRSRSASPRPQNRARSRSPRSRREEGRPRRKDAGFKWKEKRRDVETPSDARDRPLQRGYRDYYRTGPPPPRDKDNGEEDLRSGAASEFHKKDKGPKEEKKPKRPAPPAVPQEPMIIVNVNDRLGTKAAIPCLASDPIKLFKAQVAARIGREPHEILLKRQGERPFKDQLTLADYGVSNGVQLDLEVDTGD